MSEYSKKLRMERREQLALRALAFATKTEDGKSFPASDYAYVPDPDMPSTWKLRLTSSPGADPDAQTVGAAIAALGKGFRGNKVEIPSEALAGVKAKVKSAWKKANPDKAEEDMPAVIASANEQEPDSEPVYTFEIELTESEFGILPPAMKENMVKNLKKQLADEKDPDKKAEIQAKIDKLSDDPADKEKED